MRASEFILDEGKASRRKQASMNALRRNANAQKTTAPAAQPTASTGTSAPAVAPTNVGSRPNPYMTPQANIPSELDQEVQPTQPVQSTQPTQTAQLAQTTKPASSGTDWNALNQATAPAPAQPTAKPSAGSSMMGALKQKAMSAGKGIAGKFSTQGKISARTDQLFMDKFLKDMGAAEQTSTGLRGEPFDVGSWVNKYLAQNKWDAGEQQAPLDKAIAANYKPGIAKAMAAIGKYNSLGSTMKAKGPMNNMVGQLTKSSGAGPSSTVNVARPNNPNQTPATQPAAATTTPAVQVSLGGTPGQPNTLNPADPVDAKILSMLKQQGKI
jgi:hypothetical protein